MGYHRAVGGAATDGTAGSAREAFEVGRRGARRRPSGDPPPLPKASWWPRIVAALVVVILLGFVMLAAFGSNPPYGLLGWFARFQHDPYLPIAKALNWFATKTGIVVLRIAMAVVLLSFLRIRHLFVAAEIVVEIYKMVAEPARANEAQCDEAKRARRSDKFNPASRAGRLLRPQEHGRNKNDRNGEP